MVSKSLSFTLFAGMMLMVSNSMAKQNHQFLEIKLRELANSYMPEQYIYKTAPAEPCNNESMVDGKPTTNRCYGVPCKRDD